ncbi:MAG: hypothetical protein KKC46_10040 [Proteobacteria bacterium]|nr:hypothetical protein [Pseudomonadota bacterium]
MRILSIIISVAIISTITLWVDGNLYAVSINPRLGSAFGKLIEIEGRIVDDRDTHHRAHLGKKLISIQSADDHDLASPIVMELQVFTFTSVTIPKRGVWVRFRGYETGKFTGIPDEAFNDIPEVPSTDHHFESFFQITKKLKPSKPNQPLQLTGKSNSR